jgi:hypothetical protein
MAYNYNYNYSPYFASSRHAGYGDAMDAYSPATPSYIPHYYPSALMAPTLTAGKGPKAASKWIKLSLSHAKAAKAAVKKAKSEAHKAKKSVKTAAKKTVASKVKRYKNLIKLGIAHAKAANAALKKSKVEMLKAKKSVKTAIKKKAKSPSKSLNKAKTIIRNYTPKKRLNIKPIKALISAESYKKQMHKIHHHKKHAAPKKWGHVMPGF